MSAVLVTLDEAKDQIGIPREDVSRDPLLTDLLAAAEAIILDWLNANQAMRDETAAWTADTVPLPAKQAIRLEFAELSRFRGDDSDLPPRWTPTEAEGAIDLSPAIIGLLRRLRPIVVA